MDGEVIDMQVASMHEFSRAKRLLRSPLLIITVFLLLAGRVAAQEAPATTEGEGENSKAITWGFEADYNGKYVWRGLGFSQGAVMQPSLWVTARGATFSVWANRELESVDGPQLNEIDYCLSWEGKWHKAILEPCLQVYTYPDQQDSPATAMADLKISWPLGRLSVFTIQSFDVHEYSGAYYGDVGLCYEKELSSRTRMESSISLGWASAKFNETYIGPHKSALNVASLGIGLTYTAENGFYIRPHLSLTRLLNGTLRDAVEDPDIVNFGVAVGMEF